MEARSRTLVLASGIARPASGCCEDAGFDPEVVVERDRRDGTRGENTRSQVLALAGEKAAAVADPNGEAVVVGCDSMLDFDGRPYGKPTSVGEARAWLVGHARSIGDALHRALRDRRATGRQAEGVAGTEVRFARTTDAELDAYLATGDALDVAGAFTIDGRSAPFIEGVVGDPSNVIGLSLPLFRQLLSQLGIAVYDLWASGGLVQ